jgi:hypothetical protein
MALQYRRSGGVDIGHQIVGFLIAAVRMITFGQHKIGGGEVPCGDRPDIDPESLEKRECVVEEQFLALPSADKVRSAESRQHRLSLIKVNVSSAL